MAVVKWILLDDTLGMEGELIHPAKVDGETGILLDGLNLRIGLIAGLLMQRQIGFSIGMGGGAQRGGGAHLG